MKYPEISAKLIALGVDPVGGAPEEYAAQLRVDGEPYAQAIRAAGRIFE